MLQYFPESIIINKVSIRGKGADLMAQSNYRKNSKISKAVISRLPRYYRYLGDLIEEGVEKISSEELSRRMKTTASQIRQDLNNFGEFGKQGYGYDVVTLYEEIRSILGIGASIPLIVIGSGNLGRAIVKYPNFETQGFHFVGMFDVDKNICGKKVSGIMIRDISELELFLKKHEVEIAAITVPKEAANEIAEKLYALGIRYFWNFAHADLNLPNDAIIKNVNLADSLFELSYSISLKEKK